MIGVYATRLGRSDGIGSHRPVVGPEEINASCGFESHLQCPELLHDRHGGTHRRQVIQRTRQLERTPVQRVVTHLVDPSTI